MSNLVLILGESGSGKSTSIKGLDPKETVVFNILGKRLPFKGSNALYTAENKNIISKEKLGDSIDEKGNPLPAYANIINRIKTISEKLPNVKNIIIDDATYIMRGEFFNRVKEKGYDKYNELANHFRTVIDACATQRDDLNIFMLLHMETVETEGNILTYKSSSVGKLLDKLYKPEENTAITLVAMPKFDDKGNATYGFYTHRCRVNGIEIPAKTPAEMLSVDYIPNDLAIVVKAMNEYYG
jgi:hypothetical protein